LVRPGELCLYRGGEAARLHGACTEFRAACMARPLAPHAPA
jgi:hypothetical protein